MPCAGRAGSVVVFSVDSLELQATKKAVQQMAYNNRCFIMKKNYGRFWVWFSDISGFA
jgi:hypothetical protein